MRDPRSHRKSCLLAVIWIDWYAYHVARFRGLLSAPELAEQTVGIELVGGVGVHKGLKFRQPLPEELPIETLLPEGDWRTVNKWSLAWALWKALTRLQPRVVLVPGYYTLPAIAAALWAKLHRRTSVLMTESASYDHIRTSAKELLKSILIRTLFDWAVAGGKDHVKYLSDLHFPSDRVARFYDVVDNERYWAAVSRLRAIPKPAEQAHSFLFVGRLSPEKNVRGLLDAWSAYRANGGTWRLVLAGDGPERSQLQSLIADSGYAADVTITGLRSTDELLPYYAAASCFVLPSTREPWGLVVNEAMASRLPVIVSNRCGCARDLVVPDWNGFVFDPGVTEELTSCMHRMEALSNERRLLMGERSGQLIQPYSPEAFGKEIASIAISAERVGNLQPARQAS